MIKAFYKRTKLKKVFFNRNIKMRSLAYGEDVRRDFLSWREYFLKNRKRMEKGFRLSVEEQLNGTAFASREAAADQLPPLALGGRVFSVEPNGQVLANGMPCELNIGSEWKAWAIASIPHDEGIKNALFVIAKPQSSPKMKLSVYPFQDGLPRGKAEMTRDFPVSLEASNYLICLGRHVFTVQNAKLDYFYYNFELGELDEVPIGGDDANETFSWCQYVGRSIVADDSGCVFWSADDHVYGFCIGAPRHLIHIPAVPAEHLLHIRCEGNMLFVYRQNRNTKKVSCIRYTPVAGTQYRADPVPL